MKLQAILRSKMVIAMLAFCSLTAIILSSCVKKASDAAPNLGFIGIWNGEDCNGAAVYTIGAGGSSSSIQIGAWFGLDTCKKNVEVQCTVGGNYFTCPSQDFTDNCGNVYTTSASGSISGNTISMTTSITDVYGTSTCSFAGSN